MRPEVAIRELCGKNSCNAGGLCQIFQLRYRSTLPIKPMNKDLTRADSSIAQKVQRIGRDIHQSRTFKAMLNLIGLLLNGRRPIWETTQQFSLLGKTHRVRTVLCRRLQCLKSTFGRMRKKASGSTFGPSFRDTIEPSSKLFSQLSLLKTAHRVVRYRTVQRTKRVLTLLELPIQKLP